jgi:hypothetical protein
MCQNFFKKWNCLQKTAYKKHDGKLNKIIGTDESV